MYYCIQKLYLAHEEKCSWWVGVAKEVMRAHPPPPPPPPKQLLVWSL